MNSQPQPSSQGAQTIQVTGTTHPPTQRVARRQPTTQRTQPTDERNAATQPAQGAATEGAHTQRIVATQPSQRPATATTQRNASNQRTQGAQADGGPKRKRKEKQQVSATQSEGLMQRRKKLLLELRVLFQPISSNCFNDYCYVM